MTGRYTEILRTDNLVVVDDFLSSADHEALWSYFSHVNFRPVGMSSWNRARRLSDGIPLEGKDFRVEAADLAESVGALPPGLKGLMETLTAGSTLEMIETFGRWSALSVGTYIYPVGTSLSWHLDSQVLGAYIYYGHPAWDASWGGELLLFTQPWELTQSSSGGNSARTLNQLFYKGIDTLSLASRTEIPISIIPKPNRLVIFRGGLAHTIKRVEAAAGESYRASISGFVLP